ncbi:MAG: amidase domain-containing protein, partial [Clostridia bacterium]|nr:amidase domain-containing protein [Clostridia bacterium]
NRRSASWTGVNFFYDFMTTNEGVGPFGSEIALEDAQIGDVIQLSNGKNFYHTLIISEITENEVFVCANSVDSLDRPLSTYDYSSFRVIKIQGVRYDTRYQIECFDALYGEDVN